MTPNIKEKFLATIEKYKLLEKGEKLLLAVSGGVDSVCLLELFCEIKEEWNLKLCLIHLNHRLRGIESEKDMFFVESLAREKELPIISGNRNVVRYAREHDLSIEEAARLCRLEFFKKEADRLEIRKVALAHNKDDQAETVLMRIIRGTGLRGLRSIQPILDYQGLTLIRPLLEIERNAIEQYLREHRVKYRTDASNWSRKFLRNRIRLSLLPLLEKEYNPRIKDSLAQLAKTVVVDFDFLEKKASECYPKVLKKKGKDILVLNRPKFMELPEALKFRILQKTLAEFEPKSELDFYHWDKFRHFLEVEGGPHRVSWPQEVIVVLERKEIIFEKVIDTKPSYEYKLELGKNVLVKELNSVFSCELFNRRIYKIDRKDKTCAIFDSDKIKFPILIRNRKEGDRFHPLGLRYNKKLKDFLTDRKVPSYEKNLLPLFLSGQEIIWVYGQEISEWFKVTKRTKKFLKISRL